MTDTGISRGLDSLGRLVIPYELRSTLGLEPKNSVYIYTAGSAIYIKKLDGCNMTDTGITRQLDHLGRVVLPKKLRTNLDITHDDEMQIYTDEKSIVLRKVKDHCTFCGSAAVVVFHGKGICKSCCKNILEKLDQI